MTTDLDAAEKLLAKLEDNTDLVPPDPRWTLTLALQAVVRHLHAHPAPPPSPSDENAGEVASDNALCRLYAETWEKHDAAHNNDEAARAAARRALYDLGKKHQASADAATIAALRAFWIAFGDAYEQWNGGDPEAARILGSLATRYAELHNLRPDRKPEP